MVDKERHPSKWQLCSLNWKHPIITVSKSECDEWHSKWAEDKELGACSSVKLLHGSETEQDPNSALYTLVRYEW